MTAAIPGERQPAALWWAGALAGVVAAVASAYLGLSAAAAAVVATAPTVSPAGTIPPSTASVTTVPVTTVPVATVPVATVPMATVPMATVPRDCPPVFEVHFGRDTAGIDRDGVRQRAPALTAWLGVHPDTTMVVDGYADASGDAGLNLKLSYERAAAVAAELAGAGLPGDRLEARGFGEYQPLVGEAADSGHNRRVTMAVPGYEGCPLVATVGGGDQ